MQLREFTLIRPTIEAGQVFKAIESAIPIAVINDTIAQSNRQTQRQRKLPAHLVGLMLELLSPGANYQIYRQRSQHS